MIEKSRIEYTLDRPKEASCFKSVTELTESVIVRVGDPVVLITAGVTMRMAFPAVTPESVTEIDVGHGSERADAEEADWMIGRGDPLNVARVAAAPLNAVVVVHAAELVSGAETILYEL